MITPMNVCMASNTYVVSAILNNCATGYRIAESYITYVYSVTGRCSAMLLFIFIVWRLKYAVFAPDRILVY